MPLKSGLAIIIRILVISCFCMFTSLGDYEFICLGWWSARTALSATLGETEVPSENDSHSKEASTAEELKYRQDRFAKLDYASSLFWQAERMAKEGRRNGSREFAALAAEIVGGTCGFNTPEYARCLELLGRIHLANNDFALAEKQLEAARLILATLEDSSEIALRIGVTCNLATVKRELSKYADAQELFQEVLQEFDQGEKTPSTEYVGALVRIFLGNVFLDMGDHIRAQQQIEPAFRLMEKCEDKNVDAHIAALVAMGNLHRLRHEYKKSEDFLMHSSELVLEKHGNRSIQHAEVLEYLAELRVAQGQSTSAIQLFDQVISLRTQLLGTSHPTVETSRSRLRDVQLK